MLDAAVPREFEELLRQRFDEILLALRQHDSPVVPAFRHFETVAGLGSALNSALRETTRIHQRITLEHVLRNKFEKISERLAMKPALYGFRFNQVAHVRFRVFNFVPFVHHVLKLIQPNFRDPLEVPYHKILPVVAESFKIIFAAERVGDAGARNLHHADTAEVRFE